MDRESWMRLLLGTTIWGYVVIIISLSLMGIISDTWFIIGFIPWIAFIVLLSFGRKKHK